MNLPGEPPQHQNPDQIPGRRGFLKQTGALCLTALALSGCASRAPAGKAPVGRQATAPTPPAPLNGKGAAPVPALRPGARIAIVAPASAAPDASDEAAEWLEARGFVAQVMPASRTRLESPYDYLAGSDADRLADLHAAFAAPDVGAVWCLQGGFGSW
ncbi:MAG: LD-carboxypeptidase, partial [Achromobacter pestifer]